MVISEHAVLLVQRLATTDLAAGSDIRQMQLLYKNDKSSTL